MKLRTLSMFLIAAIVLLSPHAAKAQFDLKANAQYFDIKKDVVADNKKVEVSRPGYELVYFQLNAMPESLYLSKAFSVPAYGSDSLKINWRAIATSDTGTAGIAISLWGSFGDGLTADSLTELQARNTSEAKLSGTKVITPKYPYLHVKYHRVTADPKDTKVKTMVFTVPK